MLLMGEWVNGWMEEKNEKNDMNDRMNEKNERVDGWMDGMDGGFCVILLSLAGLMGCDAMRRQGMRCDALQAKLDRTE